MIRYVLPIVVILLIIIVVFYARYLRKPETQWSRRVKGRVRDLADRLDLLIHPRGDARSAAERLADELFDQQKRDTSVQALSNYPKIGPKTVEWLHDAGVRTLADAEKHVKAFIFKQKIDNVGEVREQAINEATRQCLIDERSRFDRGESDAGKDYQRRLAQLSQVEQEQAQAKARERTAIETCLDRMRELETYANRVTFLGSITGAATGITSELMAREFPKVEIAPAPPVRPLPAPVPTSPSPAATTPHPQLAHLQASCRFALLAAKADGRVAQAERGKIRSFLGDKLGSDPVLLRHLDPQLEEAERNLPEEEDAVRAIKSLTPKPEWLSLYQLASEVIDSGGERNEKESAFLSRLANAFGVEAAATTLPVVEEAPIPLPPSAPDPRVILDIPAKAEITADLLRRRYRLLTDQYDPAKAKLLGPEFAAMAEAKRAAVKLAAEELLKPLGEPLEAPEAPPPPTDLRHNPELDDLFK